VVDALKELLKQQYWVIALIVGALFVAFPCVTVDKEHYFQPHAPSTFWPMGVGLALLLASLLTYLVSNRKAADAAAGAGLDLSRVKESGGALWTTVGGCEIRVVEGRIEDYPVEAGAAVVLPCNEYFDDRCVEDKKSALGAYVNRVFEGQVEAFVSLMTSESRKRLGPGKEYQKTKEQRAESFGVGCCVLLDKPLGRSVPVALISTTTQRAGEGLSARISYMFDGMRRLGKCLADARLREVVMPILGSGHGGVDRPLAFVGLLLAVAELARSGQGGARLKRVTVVVFKADGNTPSNVDRTVVRRALALIGSQD